MIAYYIQRYWFIGLIAFTLYLVFEPAKKRKRRKSTNTSGGSQSAPKARTGGKKGQRKGLSNAMKVNKINSKIVNRQPLNEQDKAFKARNPQFKWKKR